MEFSPDNKLGKLVGFVLTLLIAVLAAGIFVIGRVLPAGLESLAVKILGWGFVLASGYYGWQTFCLHRLRYRLNDQGELVIRFGFTEKVYSLILAQISDPAEYDYVTRFSGMRWAGCFVGTGEVVTADGEHIAADFWATGPLREQLLLQTTELVLGLTAPLPNQFQDRLESAQQGGERTRVQAGGSEESAVFETPMRSDLTDLGEPTTRKRKVDLPWQISLGLYLLVLLMVLATLIWGDQRINLTILGRTIGTLEGFGRSFLSILGGFFLGLNWTLAKRLKSLAPNTARLLGIGSMLGQLLLLGLMILFLT